MIRTAESRQAPARLIQSGGKIHYTFDPQPVLKDGETHYRYSYVEIDPPVTREKVMRAIVPETEISESDAAVVDGELSVINARLDEIGQMTWAEVDAHIDTVFSGLSVAQRNSLKTLYKCVLALIKLR